MKKIGIQAMPSWTLTLITTTQHASLDVEAVRDCVCHVQVGPKRGVLLGDPLPGGVATWEFHMARRWAKRTSEEEEEEGLPSSLVLLSPSFLLQ